MGCAGGSLRCRVRAPAAVVPGLPAGGVPRADTEWIAAAFERRVATRDTSPAPPRRLI